MDPKQFTTSIKQGEYKSIYLFYGEERYLVHHYAKVLADALGEPDSFESKAPVNSIIMAAETLPFLSEKRLVHVKDSRLFVSGRKDDSEAMAAYLPQVPDSTVLLFTEADVDRRGRLYKKAMELGGVINCETPSPQALTTWLARIFKERGKTIDPAAANMLLRYTAHNMTALDQETHKLAAYVGTHTSVTTHDVESVCTPTLESKVFDLISFMVNGRAADALNMYHNMLLMKEQPLMILAMIIRQFRIILMAKAAEEKRMPKPQMAKTLGLRGFVIDEALQQGRRFTIPRVLGALEDCQDTDVKIKTGLIAADVGVELLILQYGGS